METRKAETRSDVEPATGEHPRARLDWIFRAWLRSGHVHPLLHLIYQYRSAERQ